MTFKASGQDGAVVRPFILTENTDLSSPIVPTGPRVPLALMPEQVVRQCPLKWSLSPTNSIWTDQLYIKMR